MRAFQRAVLIDFRETSVIAIVGGHLTTVKGFL